MKKGLWAASATQRRTKPSHRKFACLRKPIIQTFGCYKFSGTVSFALQAGIGVK
jgi:hypothetical protein